MTNNLKNNQILLTKNCFLSDDPQELQKQLMVALGKENNIYMDDFYELLNITTLASVPSNTSQITAAVTITTDIGAVVQCTKLMIGKKSSVKYFSDACENFYIYLTENYCKNCDLPDELHDTFKFDEKTLKQIIYKIDDATNFFQLLSHIGAKMNIIVLPFIGTPIFKGSVFLHDIKGHPKYTLILPTAIKSAGKTWMEKLVATEIAACLGDIMCQYDFYSSQNVLDEMNRWKSSKKKPCLPQLSVACKTTDLAANERRMKKIALIYKPIAVLLCEYV